jgi:hypothetical protein
LKNRYLNNSTLGTVLGKEEPVQQVDEATYADIMRGTGVPDFLIPMLVDHPERYSRRHTRNREQRFGKTSWASS